MKKRKAVTNAGNLLKYFKKHEADNESHGNDIRSRERDDDEKQSGCSRSLQAASHQKQSNSLPKKQPSDQPSKDNESHDNETRSREHDDDEKQTGCSRSLQVTSKQHQSNLLPSRNGDDKDPHHAFRSRDDYKSKVDGSRPLTSTDADVLLTKQSADKPSDDIILDSPDPIETTDDVSADDSDFNDELQPVNEEKSLKNPKKSRQKYSQEWQTKLPWLIACSTDKHAGHCTVCNVDIKCWAGITDFHTHAKRKKHIQREKEVKVVSKSIVQYTSGEINNKTRHSELQLCAWAAANNKSASDIKAFAACLPIICPDSEIARSMRLGRTKATSIITNVLGEGQLEDLAEHMKHHPFSLIADESTDVSTKKTLVLVARTFFWKEDSLQVRDCFFDLIEVTETDSRTLYDKVVSSFGKAGIPYRQNLVGYAADGAMNMTGPEKSLGALLKKDCPSLFILKCVCHSMALCAAYSCKHIPDEVEQLCKDIYAYLSCSPLRVSKFNEIQTLLELKPLKMLHPSTTRWLSLESVVKRILERYEPLRIYFGFLQNVDQVDKNRVKTIFDGLNNPCTNIYLTFLTYALNLVNKINKLFQSETTELHILHSSITRLFRTVLDNYFRPDFMKALQNLNDVKFEQQNYVELDQMYVGAAAALLIDEYVKENQISSTALHEVRTNIIRFYITLSHQILKRFNFDDPVISNMAIIDPKNVKQGKHSSILPLVRSIQNIIPVEKYQDTDDEFRELRNLDFEDLNYENDATLFWGKVLSLNKYDRSYAFPNLRHLIPKLLVLPHSSATVERVFSVYNNNKTKNRNRLCANTMKGILATKNYVTFNAEKSGSVKIKENVKVKYNYNMYESVKKDVKRRENKENE